MDALTIGSAGLRGWRAAVARTVARPVARATGAGPERVQAAVGGAFFLLSLSYVATTVRRIVVQARRERQRGT